MLWLPWQWNTEVQKDKRFKLFAKATKLIGSKNLMNFLKIYLFLFYVYKCLSAYMYVHCVNAVLKEARRGQ